MGQQTVMAVDTRSLALPRTLTSVVFRRPAALGYLLVVLAVAAGWAADLQRYITPDSGLGYALGVAGGSMMLVLLVYPLRKRLRFLASFGATRYWFRAHMMLGVLGPLAILYHCRFQLGSLNSTVALWCTLLVAVSGLVGRYLYSRIHHGLYGSRATLEELKVAIHQPHRSGEGLAKLFPGLGERLQAFDDIALAPSSGVLDNALRSLRLVWLAPWTRFKTTRYLCHTVTLLVADSAVAARHRVNLMQNAENFVGRHLRSVRRVAEFSFFDRLFSLWHVFHLPVFMMLVLSALVHVLAVHMY